MDQAQVSARLVAKVVLVVAAVVGALYFAYLIREVDRPLPDRRLLRGRDRPGGQLARPAAAFPAGWRSCSSTSAIGARDLRDRPADRAAAGQRRAGPLQATCPATSTTFATTRPSATTTTATTSPRSCSEQAQQLPTKLGDAAGTLRDVTVGVFTRFVQLFSILVITFFLVKDGHRLLEFSTDSAAGAGPADAEDRRRHLGRDLRLRVRQLRDQRPGRAGDLRDPADPRRAVRRPAGDPVRVLRPDPAGRRDARRDPGRDRGRVRQTSRSG